VAEEDTYGAVDVGEGPRPQTNISYINGTPVQVGDLILITGGRPEAFAASTQFEVVVVNNGDTEGKAVGVRAPEPFRLGHDCDGLTDAHTGWWVSPLAIERVAS